jgi:hypothetical protein
MPFDEWRLTRTSAQPKGPPRMEETPRTASPWNFVQLLAEGIEVTPSVRLRAR